MFLDCDGVPNIEEHLINFISRQILLTRHQPAEIYISSENYKQLGYAIYRGINFGRRAPSEDVIEFYGPIGKIKVRPATLQDERIFKAIK